MLIKNLTPHDINVIQNDGSIITLPKSGLVARVRVINRIAGVIAGTGINLYRSEYGAVEGIPESQNNVILVVSTLVRLAMPKRSDLVSPGDLVRDENSNVIGCMGLAVN